MPRYLPLDLPTAISAVGSDLLSLCYERPVLIAVFGISRSNQNLEVRFRSTLVFRVLDEVLLSTEGDSGGEGHVPDHLAYRVEGTVFGASQSNLINDIYPQARQYLFVTGAGCLNVISENEPEFRIISPQG